MKVRIRQAYDRLWNIEVWHWYWPFWKQVTYATDYDSAQIIADRLKNPTIVEVK